MSAAGLAARRRASAAIELGRTDDAVRFAREAVAADAEDAEAFCVLANACNVAGAHDEARRAAEKASSLDPAMEWAHACRAVALLNLDRAGDALGAIDEALRLTPSNANRHRIRARILARLGRSADARHEADRARVLAPNDAQTYDLLGDLAFAAKRYGEAEAAWRAALGIDPANAQRLNNYGAALDRQGRKNEAREAYRHAIGLDPALDIAKRNLHQSVRGALGKGTLVAGGGALAALKWCGIGASAASNAGRAAAGDIGWLPGLLVACVILVGIYFGRHAWTAHTAKQREAELEARDPALMKLYRQIDADLAAGRIRRK